MRRVEMRAYPINPIIIKQFLCFAAVGAVATSAHYSILVGLVHLWRIDAIEASVAGFSSSALVNYGANYYITFRSHEGHGQAIAKFFAVAIVGLGLNALLMTVGTKLLGLHYLVSQLIATGSVLFWNFAANRTWTFAEQMHNQDDGSIKAQRSNHAEQAT